MLPTGCADEAVPTTVKTDPSGDDKGTDEEPTDDDEPTDDEATDDEPAVKDAGKGTTKIDAGKVDAGTPTAKDAGKPASDAASMPDGGEPAARDGGNTSSKPDGSVATTGDAGGEKPASTELCHLKPYQVGVLGDSYIDLSGDFTKMVQEHARKAGALGATENYIDLARSGAAMQKDNLLAPAIPTQLPTLLSTSKRSGPEGVKLVLMTGGGNDVLIDAMACSSVTTPTEMCKTVVTKSLAVVKKLFADMAAGGIKEVVYFWYPELDDTHGKVINNYSIPLAKENCESDTSVKCHFVDTRDGFKGHPEYIKSDSIHPTAAGSQVIADLVWDVMVDNCLASK
jgi:lysophospholipase L1-like esterase